MKNSLTIIPDQTNWVTSWECLALCEILKKLDISFKLSRFSFNSFVYFPDKYAFIKKSKIYSYLSNLAICDYYHGDPTISPEFAPLLNQLKRKQDSLARVRVSHSGIHRLLLDEGLGDKVFRIPIGIELDWFPFQTSQSKSEVRRELGIPESAVVIGSFQKDGNGWGEGMEPKLIKGPDLLLETLALLKRHISELFVLLTGPSRGYVKTGLEKLKIPYRHHFLKNYPEIGRYFQALDAYLITSREEGGPKAVLESMGSGVRLISTPVGQGQDLIQTGVNGWLARSHNPEELAELTLEALQNTDLNSILLNGRQTAEKHTYSNQQELWSEFFRPLLGQN